MTTKHARKVDMNSSRVYRQRTYDAPQQANNSNLKNELRDAVRPSYPDTEIWVSPDENGTKVTVQIRTEESNADAAIALVDNYMSGDIDASAEQPAAFKGYKKGYTESDFKNDEQTVKELGRYDWDSSSYRYANLKKKYQDALRRVQKQNEFNRKNGIDLDSARQLGKAEMYNVVQQLCALAIENALIDLMEGDLSVQSVAHELKEYGYDPDWCSDDYPPEIQERMDRAQEEIANCCADLLLYNYGDLNSSKNQSTPSK